MIFLSRSLPLSLTHPLLWNIQLLFEELNFEPHSQSKAKVDCRKPVPVVVLSSVALPHGPYENVKHTFLLLLLLIYIIPTNTCKNVQHIIGVCCFCLSKSDKHILVFSTTAWMILSLTGQQIRIF